MAYGPDAGLALLDPLEATEALAGYYLLPATRADLERRAGRPTLAATAYLRMLADHSTCQDFNARRKKLKYSHLL